MWNVPKTRFPLGASDASSAFIFAIRVPPIEPLISAKTPRSTLFAESFYGTAFAKTKPRHPLAHGSPTMPYPAWSALSWNATFKAGLARLLENPKVESMFSLEAESKHWTATRV